MSTIAVVKIAMGYRSSDQRPSCSNCLHASTGTEHPPRWRCQKGSFFTTAMATCSAHALKALPTEGVRA